MTRFTPRVITVRSKDYDDVSYQHGNDNLNSEGELKNDTITEANDEFKSANDSLHEGSISEYDISTLSGGEL